MRLARQQQDWDELADLDPYWAILSRPGKRHGRWDEAEFFATGRSEAARVLERAAELGAPGGRRSALDFGCGVGRVSRALAEHFDTVTGVDVSETMIERAKALNAEVANCTFRLNAEDHLGLLPDASFDLVYSYIVLQHVPDPTVIRSYIAEFVRLLAPGGLALFQLPSHIPAVYRLQWRRRLYLGLRAAGVSPRVLYGRLKLVPISMNSLSETDVRSLLGRAGATVLAADTIAAVGLLNTGLRTTTYFVSR